MSRAPQSMIVRGIKSIGRGVAALTIRARVTEGPAMSINREVNFFMADTDLTMILTTLAQMPAYRDVFRIIADEIDWRERIANDPDNAPVTRRAHDLASLETTSRLH